MLAFLPNLLSHSSVSIGTVLHIGAGVGSELETYQNLSSENIVAVEPDAVLFKKLSAKAKRYNNAETVQTWIGEKSTKTEAQIFANPRFNSLLPAGTLLDHFANLKQPKVIQVKTLSLSEFLSNNLSLDQSKKNILVIEAQGFEVKLLQACEVSLLQHFSVIVVRTSEEFLYQDGASAKQLSACLGEKSYDLVLSDISHLPFVEHYYQLNHSQVALIIVQEKQNKQQQINLEQVNRLNEQLAEQTQNLSKLQSREAALQQSSKEKDQEVKKLIAQLATDNENTLRLQTNFQQADTDKKELQEQLDNSKQNLDNQLAKIEELRHAHQKVTALKHELESQLSDTNNKLSAQQENENALKQELATGNQTLLENIEKLKDFKQQLDELASKNAKLENQLSDTNNKLSAQQENENALKQELATANQTLLENIEKLKDFKQQLDELVSKNAKLENQLSDTNKKLAEQTHWHQENKGYADALLKEKENLAGEHLKLKNELIESSKNSDNQILSLSKQKDQLKEQLQQNKKWVESLKKQIEQLTVDLRIKSRNADMGQMMLAKSSVDLESLRVAYGKKVESETTLVELVKELKQKLVQASKYYFQLQQDHPELISTSENDEKN